MNAYICMYVSILTHMYIHVPTQKERKRGKMLKTGKFGKGFSTMYSVNLRLFQN